MGCVSSKAFRKPETPLLNTTLSLLDPVVVPKQSTQEPVQDVKQRDIRFAQGNYKFESVLGKGGFGLVVSVKEKHTDNMFALKIEQFWRSSARKEEDVYQLLQDVPGIPQCYGHWDENGCTLMRMELLGVNLGQYSKMLKRSLNTDEMSDLAVQMIDLLKNVHQLGYVHCDVKPSNFAFGIGKNKNVLYLIDFGIAESFLGTDGSHIQDNRIRKPKGTAPYMSAFQHARRFNTRRDDMEGIVYTLLDLCYVSFPWRKFTLKRINHEVAHQLKMSYIPSIPSLRRMLKMCRKTKFDEEPDYERMKKLFKNKTSLNWDLKPENSTSRHEVKLNENDQKILEKFNFDNMSNVLLDENFL
ncbi:unnamed protein product [Caenorhabditis brenneri]